MSEEWEFKQRKLLGSQLPRVNALYQKLSCIAPKQRRAIAAIEVFKILFPNRKLFQRFTYEQVEKALEALGIGRWGADLLTELAAKTARVSKPVSVKKELEEGEEDGEL